MFECPNIENTIIHFSSTFLNIGNFLKKIQMFIKKNPRKVIQIVEYPNFKGQIRPDVYTDTPYCICCLGKKLNICTNNERLLLDPKYCREHRKTNIAKWFILRGVTKQFFSSPYEVSRSNINICYHRKKYCFDFIF